MNPFRIVFMGTSDFATPALRALHAGPHTVALVATQPDRPKGRGRKLAPPPVKTEAVRLGYDVIQPETVTTDDFAEQLVRVKPDLFVVAAYGHILPKHILDIPKKGAVNIHGSLLPKYRGAAPIQRAILNMEKETGVTIMFMDDGMDTGDILAIEMTSISQDDTASTLHDRLADIGAALLIQTLEQLSENRVSPVPQDHSRATYAPILKKREGRIDWTLPAEHIEAFIRGMTPWPGAFTFHADKRLRILNARLSGTNTDAEPGTVVWSDGELQVATGKGVLCIDKIQAPSGKKLPIGDFLRGYSLPEGSAFARQ